MAAAVTITTSGIDKFFKNVYSKDKTQLLIERDHPVFKRIKKEAISQGAGHIYSIGLTYAQGLGNSLADLITNDTTIGTGAKATTVTFKVGDDYAVLNLDQKSLRLSKGSEQAFAEQLTYQTDSLLMGLGDQMTAKMFGDGSGKLAACTAILSTDSSVTTITLSNTDDTKYFQVGMEIQPLVAAGTLANISTTGDFVTISAINESTGVLTVNSFDNDEGSESIVAWGRRGTVGVATTSPGMAAWIPLTAPSGTTVGNALITVGDNRSGYQTLLGGHRLDDVSMPIDEAAFKICQKIYERGGRPSAIYCSYDVFNALAIRQWNRIVPTDKMEASTTGGKSFGLVTPMGLVPFIVDPFMLKDRCFVVDESSWRLCHLTSGMTERITEASGKGDAFALSQDAIQLRWRAWWGLKCLAPVKNGVFSVSV